MNCVILIFPPTLSLPSLFKQQYPPFHSQMTTSDMNSPMAQVALSSQESAAVFPPLTTFRGNGEVEHVEAVNFVEICLRTERKLLLHSKIFPIRYQRNQNDFIIPFYAMGTLLDMRHHFLLESIVSCSRNLMTLT